MSQRFEWITRMTSAVLALAAIFLTSCAIPPPPKISPLPPVNQFIEEGDIREAVFRYRINSCAPREPIFLSIDGKDPSERFMARFRNENRHFKGISKAYLKTDLFPGWLRDRKTDEKGVSLEVGAIEWVSPTIVEVHGGKYCGGLCADTGIFRVVKKNGNWIVENYRVLAIS